MVASYSIFRDLKNIWNDLDAPAQLKLEKVVCKAAERYLPEDDADIGPVRSHLLGTDGTFMERLSLAALHPGTKKYFVTRTKNALNGPDPSNVRKLIDVPNDIMVRCNNCGMAKAVHLHDEEVVSDLIIKEA
jgi:hypothetical protein